MTFTSSFLHLDGVEFKLSDSLQPPPIRALPSEFRMKDPSSLLRESNYDFAKEKDILAKIESLREGERKMAEQENMRKQMSLKRRADADKQRLEEMMTRQREVLQTQKELFLEQKRKQKEESESKTADQTSAKEGTSPSASDSSPVYENFREEPPPRNPFSQVGKDLLMPQPAAANAQDSSSSSSSQLNQSQPVVAGQSQIWVDFEDKELDPFTNMELKTIDDLAELETVLQNVSLADQLPTYEEVASTSRTKTKVKSEKHNIAISESSRYLSPETDQDVDSLTHNTPRTTEENTLIPGRSEESKEQLNEEALYENSTSAEIKNISADAETNNEGLYDFADLKSTSESDETAKIRATFEKGMARKPPENSYDEDAALYTVARPKTRARKTSPEPSSTQFDPAVTGFQPSNPASTSSDGSTVSTRFGPSSSNFGLANPVPTGYIQSQSPVLNRSMTSEKIDPVRVTRFRPEAAGPPVQALISPVVSPTAQANPAVRAKVLPIIFGGVTNSLSAPALPPISTLPNGGSLASFNPGSLSTPNTTRPPVPAPRRPPVPPRDTAVSLSPPLPSRSQPNIPYPPQNGPTLGQSHLLPPYALPQPNGLASSSSTPAFLQQVSPPLTEKVTSAPTSGTAGSFLQKSQEDRAKFAETVNKALSSLPQNPKPVVKHKPTIPHGSTSQAKGKSQAFSNYKPLPSMSRSLSLKSSLVAGLSSEEQEFVKNMTTMGFDLKATVRATQKYGLDAKEVVDHLCHVQTIVEQGYSTRTVQDALEMFENDNKMVVKFLQQASQLMDMGFKEDDVREALKSSSNDQTKALDQLMGQS